MPRNYTFGSEDPLCDTEIDSVTSSAQVPCCSKPQTNSCCPSCWPSLTRQLSGSTPPRNSKTPQWLLIFIAAGILQTVIAFLVGAIYFSIRALTSSLEHIETIPTYANGILVRTFSFRVLWAVMANNSLWLGQFPQLLTCLFISQSKHYTQL